MSKVIKPTLCVVAGPNGSGKTSTTIQLLSNEWSEGKVFKQYTDDIPEWAKQIVE